MVNFFLQIYIYIWQRMTFLNPFDALIPKISLSFFPDFWVWVTSKARGSISVGFWGSRQLSPLLGEGWGPARGLYRPPPPLIESPSAHVGWPNFVCWRVGAA